MLSQTVLMLILPVCTVSSSHCLAQDQLFEDSFDAALSDRWKPIGLDPEDYRIRDGAVEMRLKPVSDCEAQPMLKVDVPFATADSVTASVDVKLLGDGLKRGDAAGLCLLDPEGISFSVMTTNIDGCTLPSPGDVGFIGREGREGNPGKYRPADEAFGPLRILVRDHYAYFQVGPSADNEFKTFFHSAIRESRTGMSFALIATSGSDTDNADRWVRFDNLRVVK
jgi:hypothetical protein